VPSPLLRRITRTLVCEARKLLGQPMLHDLVSKASDLLDHLHPDDEMSEDEEVSGAVVCVCVSGCVCV